MTMRTVVGASILLLAASSAYADQVRVYCRDDGQAIIESRVDGDYNPSNVIENSPNFIIERENIPTHAWTEQLRCQGQGLFADQSIKPPRIVRREKVELLGTQLDSALSRPNPDPVEVIRLQRAIEKLKN